MCLKICSVVWKVSLCFFLSILLFFFFEKFLYLPAVSEHFKLFNVVELFGHSEIVQKPEFWTINETWPLVKNKN